VKAIRLLLQQPLACECEDKWKFFESFWGMSYLSSAFIRGLDQKDMDKFLKKVSIIE